MKDQLHGPREKITRPRFSRLQLKPIMQNSVARQMSLDMGSFADVNERKTDVDKELQGQPLVQHVARVSTQGPKRQFIKIPRTGPVQTVYSVEREVVPSALMRTRQAEDTSEVQTVLLPAQLLPKKEHTPIPASLHGEIRVKGFDLDDPEFDKLSTVPMMVLQGISAQKGQDTPVMQSEISGAASGAAIVGAGTILGNVLRYGNNFILQRGFGPVAYGLYTLCMSLVMLVAAIFNLGLDDVMIRYVSIYRGKKQSRLLQGLVVFCSIVAGVAGIVGALILLYFTPALAAFRSANQQGDVVQLLQILAPMVPLLCMQAVWTSGLQGFKAFKWNVLTQRLIAPAVLFVLLIGMLMFYRHLIGIALATLISTLVGTVCSLYFFVKMTSQTTKAESEAYGFREWFNFASLNFLSSIVETALESVDTVLLSFFSVTGLALGQYAAAIRFSYLIAMPLQSLNVMFTPTIAELYSKGEYEKLAAMFKIVTKWTITFSLPIFWITVLFSRSLLVLSGDKFADAWPLMIAFAIGSMINAGTGCVGYMLLMTGHQKLSFINSLTAVVVNIALGIILTPRFGAMGTAISTGIALGVVNIMRLIQVRILLKILPYRWDTLKPVGASFISAGVTGGLLYLVSLTHWSLNVFKIDISAQLGLIPVFCILYVVLLSLFRVSPEDRIVLDKLSKKFKQKKK